LAIDIYLIMVYTEIKGDTAMKTKKRYMRKSGDRRDCYEVSGTVSVKWHITYKILKVTYNAEKDVTTLVLEKNENRYQNG
jgi:hypothetical protein